MTGSLLETYAVADALDLASLVKRGAVSPMELVEAAITRIEHLNPRLNAVAQRLYDAGRASAAMVDRQAPFAGVPFLLNEIAEPHQTALPEDAPPAHELPGQRGPAAIDVSKMDQRIRAAGLVVLGTSNASELGFASTGSGPQAASRNPGRMGTAGPAPNGGAVAVAACMVPIAEAAGGAGSILIPAAHCGVVGLKPSRGRIRALRTHASRHGGTPPFCYTRTVRDTAAFLDAFAGDPHALPAQSWLQLSLDKPRRLRIGFSVTPPNGAPIDPLVKDVVLGAVHELEGFGHLVEEYETARDGDAAWKIDGRLAQSAADIDLRKADGIAQAGDAEKLRGLGRKIVDDLSRYDIFITPTLMQVPCPMGQFDREGKGPGRHPTGWSDGAFTLAFDISGQPAISLPLGWTPDEVPIGVQLVGRPGDEAGVLAISTLLEYAMPWKTRRAGGREDVLVQRR